MATIAPVRTTLAGAYGGEKWSERTASMREDLVPGLARAQHDTLVAEYEAQGVAVHLVENARMDKPNSFFIRDLMLMTPEGAIITRPASTLRAGEERFVA